MDIITLIGLLVGLAGIIGGFLLEGGQATTLVGLTAAVIVFGGTFGATILSFSWDDLKTMPYFCRKIFVNTHPDYLGMLDMVLSYAYKARRDGILSLEKYLPEIMNPLLVRGLQLIVDGVDPELTQKVMEMEIESYENREKVGCEVFMVMGGFAPTMGIIGTVMGLIYVLGNVNEPDRLAGAIAVVFLATLYGVVSANLLWIPFANKLRGKMEKEIIFLEFIVEGVLSIQAGQNPRIIEEKLVSLLPASVRYKSQDDDFTADETAGVE